MTSAEVSILNRIVKRMKKSEEDPLRPLLDAYFMRREASEARLDSVTLPIRSRPRPGGRLSPSALGGCQRAAVFQFVGIKGRKHIDPDSEAIFDDGNWRHHRWQTLFKDMEVVLGRQIFRLLEIEKSVSIPDLYVAGSLDATIWIKNYGRLVVDIKGINDAGYNRITINDEPLPKHVVQLITYEQARGVHRGMLLYENKNNQQVRTFLVHSTPEHWEEIRKWADFVIRSMERRRLPNKDVECQAGNFLFEKCPYSSLCYGQKDHEEIREIAYNKFPGVDVLWRRGHRIARTANLAQTKD